MKDQCKLYPLVDGKPSKLYKDLLDKLNNRPLTNLIYAAYLQPGVADKLRTQGYSVNKQGEHDVTAVMQFFDVNNMKLEASKINDVARRFGTKDNLGDLIDFSDAEKAMEKALSINSNTKGTVAFVVQHGDKFNVLVEPKDSRTITRSYEVLRKSKVWDILKQTFATKDIDLNKFDFNKTLVNANNVDNFMSWLKNLPVTRNDLYTQKDIETILSLDEKSSQVERLKTMFGSIDKVAAKVYDALHGGKGYTKSQIDLMSAALDNCKKIQGLDIEALSSQIDVTTKNLSNTSEEIGIQDTLKELDKKYGIDINNIHKKSTRIKQLSDAAVEAVLTLQRQLRKLKAEDGVTTEVKELNNLVDKLMTEISNKRYYSGVLGFLNKALQQVQVMEDLIKKANETPGTNLERCLEKARTLVEIQRIQQGYSYIVEALSNIKDLIIDESIDSVDLETIEKIAKEVKEYFDKYKERINDIREDLMIDICTEILGKEVNGESIANLVAMAKADSSLYDYLYSVGRVSNPLIAAMGTIIRDAQSDRAQELNKISLRIRRATNELYASGSDSSFMYEMGGRYIISDIDWLAYSKAMKKAKNRFINKGLKGLNLEEAMESWQEANTEDRVVDFVSGRTERVPNGKYRKEFPQLTEAQMKYYTEMMQIKGELGTLLPSYAQKHYLPPQRRRNFIDAIVASKGNPKKIAKAILNKIKDAFVVREDDTLFADNGIIDQDEYAIKYGDLDNTPYRQIPIFFINRLKEKEEIMTDFSGAMQSLAGTAINYEHMNKIKDLVEFMGDFIKDQNIHATKDGKKQADTVVSKGVSVAKDLCSFASNTNTAGIIDGFIDQHIYGVKLKNPSKWSRLFQTILNYNSIRNLAVNVKGMIANVVGGEIQILIESGAGEFYNLADYAYAHAKVFGDITAGLPGIIMDVFTNNKNSMVRLLMERFDPLNEIFDENYQKRYFSKTRHLIPTDFAFIGYGIGETLLHLINMYCILHHEKIVLDGKPERLISVLEKTQKVDGNSELKLKDGEITDFAGNIIMDPETMLDKIRDKIRYANQTTQGSMNEEDKGLIHQRMIGKYIMNLRQWMVEHYSRRFRKLHWDDTLKKFREGYYYTTFRLFAYMSSRMFKFESEYATSWGDMTNDQKANVRRTIAEQLILFSLLGLEFALGDPDEHKKEFWYRMWIYQTKRAIMEVRGSTPYGVPMELDKLINSPIPATNTINSLMYPITGLADLNKKVIKGPYKGYNLYCRNLLRYWAPFYNQIDQLNRMDIDDSVFNIFDSNRQY